MDSELRNGIEDAAGRTLEHQKRTADSAKLIVTVALALAGGLDAAAWQELGSTPTTVGSAVFAVGATVALIGTFAADRVRAPDINALLGAAAVNGWSDERTRHEFMVSLYTAVDVNHYVLGRVTILAWAGVGFSLVSAGTSAVAMLT